MKLDIPFLSQYRDVESEEWKPKACAVVCVAMILSHNKKEFDLNELIEEGVKIDGFSKHGWKHDSLVILLHNHGVPAYREEFRSIDENVTEDLRNYGVKKIKESLDSNEPVQASVVFEGTGFHMVLITGYDENGFYYNDPEKKTDEEGKDIFVSNEDFIKGWRGMVIFPSKI